MLVCYVLPCLIRNNNGPRAFMLSKHRPVYMLVYLSFNCFWTFICHGTLYGSIAVAFHVHLFFALIKTSEHTFLLEKLFDFKKWCPGSLLRHAILLIYQSATHHILRHLVVCLRNHNLYQQQIGGGVRAGYLSFPGRYTKLLSFITSNWTFDSFVLHCGIFHLSGFCRLWYE